jgi:hypothetical protein
VKEEFKIARSNVVPYSSKRFFKNPIYARSFSNFNGRAYDPDDRGLVSQAFQRGFANGLNAKQPFFRVWGEATNTGPTLSPQRAPSGISITLQDAVPEVPEDLSLEGDIKDLSCGPPCCVYVEGRQIGFEIVCQEMVYDWWHIIGKAWYYAQLYRLERGYEIFPEEKKVLRVHGVTSYDENIRREN